MSNVRHICIDRLLPLDINRPRPTRMMNDGRTAALGPKGKQWVNGSTITIRFMDGTASQQAMVKDFSTAWTDHANLHFEFTDDPRAKIRITFDADDGAWSYIGIDNLGIPLSAATLNLGWQDEGVILHEFGHMIGLSHEHSSPMGGIIWNEEAVIRDLSGSPNFWDEATIRHNVLRKYEAEQVNGTEFDPASIMLYAFPDSWTQNMGATQENDTLSDLDELFVKSAKMYPGRAAPAENAVSIPVCSATAADISAAGEEDLYQFEVAKAGAYIIQTSGSTDVVMSLFGPDNPTNKIAENDDGGAGTNARVNVELQPGTYYARIRHYSAQRTGQYRIQVSAL